MSRFWSSVAKRTNPYVPGEQLDREDILKLNTNENPYPPSPAVMAAIQAEMGHKLRLYPSPTVDSLREEIAAFHSLRKENVFVGNGSDEVLAFSFMAFFEPGKKIRFPAITYSFYPVYAKLFDIPFEEVPLHHDFTIATDTFFGANGGVIFPNPNAPTGVYLALNDVEAIVKKNPDQVVIIDEAYIDFASGSAASLVGKYENLLVVQTTSKSRSLAGLRVGYALGDPVLTEGLTRIKDSFNSYTIDRLAIAGARAAFQDVAYFKESIHKIIETRKWVVARMKALGFNVVPSQANFIFASHGRVPAKLLYSELKQSGVLVRHFDKQPINNFLRITIGTGDEMELFLEKLQDILSTRN